MHLPNYGVFDEKRYFKAGSKEEVIKGRDFSFLVNICEDIWIPEPRSRSRASSSADFIVNISASPYHIDKVKERSAVLSRKAKFLGKPVIYCNLIGGQDELVFDGRSMVFDRNAKILAEGVAFEEDFIIFDLEAGTGRNKKRKTKGVTIDYKIKTPKKSIVRPRYAKKIGKLEEIYSALVLGVRDYVRKNNFRKVAFGVSGGIDSALVGCIAVDALGPVNVLALCMPSRYSSAETQSDAEKVSRNLGIRFVKIPIDGIFDAYLDTLGGHFAGMESDITEENIQARIRGNILMAFSNKFGCLVLNTGNKSETSVGYCTLYGDMAGGFAVIKDVPKSLVNKLARYVNDRKESEVIPISIIKRAPSAELRPGQKDQDLLPSYELLDKIIDLYIEKRQSLGYIAKKIGRKNIVESVLRMIDLNEYKRRQASPGIKITPTAFGRDRRMPITNKFTEAKS